MLTLRAGLCTTTRYFYTFMRRGCTNQPSFQSTRTLVVLLRLTCVDVTHDAHDWGSQGVRRAVLPSGLLPL